MANEQNPTIVQSTTQVLTLGTLRHVLSTALAAWGTTAYLGSEKTELLIAVLLGLANLAWFVIEKKMNSYKQIMPAHNALDDSLLKKK